MATLTDVVATGCECWRGWCDRYDVLSQLPASLSDVTVESDSLSRLMSGIKQLGYLTSVNTRDIAAKLRQFVFQVSR